MENSEIDEKHSTSRNSAHKCLLLSVCLGVFFFKYRVYFMRHFIPLALFIFPCIRFSFRFSECACNCIHVWILFHFRSVYFVIRPSEWIIFENYFTQTNVIRWIDKNCNYCQHNWLKESKCKFNVNRCSVAWNVLSLSAEERNVTLESIFCESLCACFVILFSLNQIRTVDFSLDCMLCCWLHSISRCYPMINTITKKQVAIKMQSSMNEHRFSIVLNVMETNGKGTK